MTIERISSIAILIGTVSIWSSIALAADPDGRELVDGVERLLWGRTNHGVSEMTVVTPDWQRTLRLRFWMDRPTRTLIRIQAPPKEAGIGSLRVRDEMWNYLPKIERTIKIPPSMMLQSWMGSDFTNDDLVKQSRVVEDYTHRLSGIVTLDGEKVYRVESIPKPEAAVVWGKIVYFIRVADRIPVKQEYYSERNELIRVMTFSHVQSMGGRRIPTRWVMQPVRKPDHRTQMVIREMTFDQPLSPGFFTLLNLKRVR